MPLTRFKLTAISDDGVTSAKLAHNLDFDGTHIRIPHGTTAQRPGSPVEGMLRFNTTEKSIEQYNGIAWAVLASPPVINNVSPTTTNGDSGTLITINGLNFTAESTVKFIDQGGTEFNSGTTTFVNSTQLTATFPQNFTISQEPLDVKVITPIGENTLADSIDLGGVPTFTTPAGALASGFQGDSYSATVTATDPEGGDVDYTLSSGALPAGLTLNTETGVISGTMTAEVRTSATSTATIVPNDNAGNNGPGRTFTITQTGDGDDNFEYVTTRLTMDGTNDSANMTFGASRVGSLTPTKTGLPSAGDFSPHHPEGYWSTSHRGGYDGYKIASTSELTLGSNPYTIEFWLKETADHSASQARYTIMGVSGSTVWEIATDSGSDNLRFTYGSTNVFNFANFSNHVPRNTWAHIAVVREGTGSSQVYFYINGVYRASGTDATNHGVNNLHIGGLDWATGYSVNGWMSNFRISTVARYTNGSSSIGAQVFTAPTSPFTSDGNTVLLTCASNRRRDKSPTNTSVGYNNNITAASGGPSITCHSPFLTPNKRDTANLGSAFVDGVGDGLTYANNAAFQVGTGDFSWTFWVYIPWDSQTYNYWGAVASFNGIGYQEDAIAVYIANDTYNTMYFDIGQTNVVGGYRVQSNRIVKGEWNYIEVSRSGTGASSMKYFINGYQVGSGASINFSSSNSYGMAIGYSDTTQNSGSGNYTKCYISDMKVVKGTAGNTSAYTTSVPSSVATNTTNTTFLFNPADDCNVHDETGMHNWAMDSEYCLLDTTSKKFGTASLMTNTNDGSTLNTGSFLIRDHKYKRELDFVGDWTIDMWINGHSSNLSSDPNGGYRRLFDSGGGNGANALQLLINITGGSYGQNGGAFAFDNSGKINNTHTEIVSGGQPNVCDGQWHHLRFVHDVSASLIYEYTDGTLYSTRVTSGTQTWRGSANAQPPRFGAHSTATTGSRFLGRIDDVRIYNGYAIGTGTSYTVPTREKPVW